MRLAADSYLIVERALADAFEGRVDFEKLGRRLDLRLSDLVGDNADDEAIRIALIQHAEREDGVEALIVAARKINGANKLLAAIDVAALAFRDSAPLRPRELRVDVKIRVRDVLLAAFPDTGELTELLSLSYHRGTAVWKQTWPPGDNLLRCVRAAAKEGWLPDLLQTAARSRPDDHDLRALITEWGCRRSSPVGQARPEEVLRRCSLSGGFFLINRDPLRASFGQMLPVKGHRVLVVQGENESGLSHSLRMLYELRDAYGFQIAEVDLDVSCRGLGPRRTFSPVDLARELFRELEYDERALPRERDDKQWSAWIVDFIREFERRARRDPRRVYVVLDALNRVRLNQPTADLLGALGTSIGARLPHFRLVLVGFRAELPRAIRQAALVDHTCDLTQEDVVTFFAKAHREASVEIDATGLVQKVVNVMQGQPSAPPGKLLDLADRVKLEMPRAVTADG